MSQLSTIGHTRLRNNICYIYEKGIINRASIWEDGKEKRVCKRFDEKTMKEYDDQERIKYEGSFIDDVKQGYPRTGKGKLFDDEGRVITEGDIDGYSLDTYKGSKKGFYYQYYYREGTNGDYSEFENDKEIAFGYIENGVRTTRCTKSKIVLGFYEEREITGRLIAYSQMNENHQRHGLCYLYTEEGYIQSVYEFQEGKSVRQRKIFKNDKIMIVYDDEGNIKYEGEYDKDPCKGFARSGTGSEYNLNDKKGLLYTGSFANDLPHGKGDLFLNGYKIAKAHFKNGLLHGSYAVVRNGERVGFRYYYRNHSILCVLFFLLFLLIVLCVFIGFLVDIIFFRTVRIKTVDDLINISPRTLFLIAKPNCCANFGSDEFIMVGHSQLRLIRIDANNFDNVTYFQVGEIPSLKKLTIGDQSFSANSLTKSVISSDFSFSVFNCSSLQSITIGKHSFDGFIQFDISTLPSLQTIIIGDSTQESNNFMDAPLKLIGSSHPLFSPSDLPSLLTLDLGRSSFINAPLIEIEGITLQRPFHS